MIPQLPPLPPLPGEDDEYGYRPAGRSIVALLSEEHEQLIGLASELSHAEAPQRELADVVTATVARHLSAEEQYLYPAVKAALPDGDLLTQREISRDTQILKLLALLETVAPNSGAFAELAAALDADLRLHAKVCRLEIFPQLRANLSEVDLIRLGNRVEVAKEAAPTRPHPDSPTQPPWNKLTEPALGVVDKLRDVVTGRTTYPEDL